MKKDIYNDFKIFSFQNKIEDIRRNIISSPVHVRLKPTNRCNHRCSYCCYRSKNLHMNQLFDEQSEIPWKSMKKIIKDLALMGVKAVTFSGGGEPLLYPYFNDTVKRLCAGGIKIGLLTNGSLLNGESATLLSKYASWVRVSMDAAVPQTYIKTRGVERKEFEKVCNNIEKFSKNKTKGCQLGVNYIVTKNNYKEVYSFLCLMQQKGVNHAKISEAVISTDNADNKNHYARIIDCVNKQIAKATFGKRKVKFTVINKVDNFNFDSYKKEYKICLFSQCLTVIGADMNIYICQDKAYSKDGVISSIKDGNFREAWLSEKTSRKLLTFNPANNCVHHCTQHNKNIMLLEYLSIHKGGLEFV